MCGDKVCVDKVCGENVCGDKVCVDKVCGDKVCVDKVCVDKVCGDKVCGDKVCVDKVCGEKVFVCVRAGGGGRTRTRRRSPGYRIKNKNPTQSCGEKETVPPKKKRLLHLLTALLFRRAFLQGPHVHAIEHSKTPKNALKQTMPV